MSKSRFRGDVSSLLTKRIERKADGTYVVSNPDGSFYCRIPAHKRINKTKEVILLNCCWWRLEWVTDGLAGEHIQAMK